MAPETWYELFPGRLVLETIRVKSFQEELVLEKSGDTLYWECEAKELPAGVEVPPLRFRVVYPEAFPAIPPQVEIISPEIDPTEWGHNWHRWPSGDICFVRPVRWQVSTTADEIIKKVEDWYFNFTAKKAGLVAEMPDIGRAEVPRKDDTETGNI